MKFAIKEKMKTHNELKRIWSNPRPHVGRALYRHYKEKLFVLLSSGRQGGILYEEKVKRTVTILYYTKRLQDSDNFIASLKPLLDVMVDMEILVDDSPKWIKLIAEQEIDSGKAYRIEIEVS